MSAQPIEAIEEWDLAWDTAISAINIERMLELASELAWIDADEVALHPALLRAFQSDDLLRAGFFARVCIDCLIAWSGWTGDQRAAILAVLVPRLHLLAHPGEVAVLGDWISEAAPLDEAKRLMIWMVRAKPDLLGDMLFSMRSTLFPRLPGGDRDKAEELHRVVYQQGVDDAEEIARRHEAMWDTQG